ncbi:MAG: tripartite tricarboxylate transporter substrate-binding protein [Caldimonas sp.]
MESPGQSKIERPPDPHRNAERVLADARKNPGAYTYGSSGNYGTMHVPMEMLKAEAGFHMTHIPYTGAGPAVVALLSG